MFNLIFLALSFFGHTEDYAWRVVVPTGNKDEVEVAYSPASPLRVLEVIFQKLP